ncbi:MAG: xanthine dehydrogenase, partial [Bacteroidetes bacterium HGW-Bacteroidetes-22]
VVTTYEHKLDIEITAVAARTCPLYIGLIGSKGKLALARKRFTEDFGLTDELINRIDMPIGVAIAAETPDEIALAILASLIDARNRSHGLKSKK